jgi:hypothetical protein
MNFPIIVWAKRGPIGPQSPIEKLLIALAITIPIIVAAQVPSTGQLDLSKLASVDQFPGAAQFPYILSVHDSRITFVRYSTSIRIDVQ